MLVRIIAPFVRIELAVSLQRLYHQTFHCRDLQKVVNVRKIRKTSFLTVCRSVVLLVTDILQGAVLQPIFDLVPDPDRCVNLLIEISFDPEPSRRFPAASGTRVQMLEHFVSAHQESRQWVRTNCSLLLPNQVASFNFVQLQPILFKTATLQPSRSCRLYLEG